jgi:hypothetical protein
MKVFEPQRFMRCDPVGYYFATVARMENRRKTSGRGLIVL